VRRETAGDWMAEVTAECPRMTEEFDINQDYCNILQSRIDNNVVM
jgi:hypothetical protein